MAVVGDFLRERRALLIWDNFESIRDLPDPWGQPHGWTTMDAASWLPSCTAWPLEATARS